MAGLFVILALEQVCTEYTGFVITWLRVLVTSISL